MNAGDLINIASLVGIKLHMTVIPEANLYLLVDQEDHTLYVGKANSEQRHKNEDQWKSSDYRTDMNHSGIVALMAENNSRRVPLSYDPSEFTVEPILQHIESEKWNGTLLDEAILRIKDGLPPSVAEVEEILIRIHIRTGRVIGNSQYASQWEKPIGRFPDTVAALAADAAWERGILPKRIQR